MTPVGRLRAAAKAERVEWGDGVSRRVYPGASALHLAVADLLDAEADAMESGEPVSIKVHAVAKAVLAGLPS